MNKQELRTNKQELISKYELLKNSYNFNVVATDGIISDLKRLDEPESGHADEAPRYLKNVLARLRELPLHDREIWLKAIMGEFEQDFSHAKWREGYEQGKFEGAWVGNQLKDADKIRRELNKVQIPQFVADWIEEARKSCKDVADLFNFDFTNEEVGKWFMQERPFDLVARAWLDGYEVGKEKRYYIRLKGVDENYNYLNFIKHLDGWVLDSIKIDKKFRTAHTRKELEEADFGWVFDCPGIDVEEKE